MVNIKAEEIVREFEILQCIHIGCNNCFKLYGNYLDFISYERILIVKIESLYLSVKLLHVNDNVYCECCKFVGKKIVDTFYEFPRKSVRMFY